MLMFFRIFLCLVTHKRHVLSKSHICLRAMKKCTECTVIIVVSGGQYSLMGHIFVGRSRLRVGLKPIRKGTK